MLLIHSLHRIDMYSIQSKFSSSRGQNLSQFLITAGTARDVSFLIDFLPAYLYPSNEKCISGWGVAGISLGGHSTWISLSSGMFKATSYTTNC